MPKWHMVAPIGFEETHKNISRSGKINTYHGIVDLKDGYWVIVTDIRIRDILESNYGFQTIKIEDDPKLARKPPKPKRKLPKYFAFPSQVELDSWPDFDKELDLLPREKLLEDKKMVEYCKVCGKGYKRVNRSHVLSKHDITWEEYMGLPVMIPNIGMQIYWESEELQKMFPDPLNLLCGTNQFANYLDFLKLEGSRRYQSVAKYYDVPFVPKGRAFTPSPPEPDYDYCKVCGQILDKVNSHIKSHGMTLKAYEALPRTVPKIGLTLWHKHLDLRKAFPNPMLTNSRYGPFASFLHWLETDGVKKYPNVRNYFLGKEKKMRLNNE